MERLAAADRALRNLERLQPPLAFQLMPRLGQAIAQPIDVPCPLQHHRPESLDERIGDQRRDPPGHATAKAGEQIRVQDPPLFEGQASIGPVEEHCFAARIGHRSAGRRQGGVLHRIAVDHQVHGRRAMPAGQRANAKFLNHTPGWNNSG